LADHRFALKFIVHPLGEMHQPLDRAHNMISADNRWVQADETEENIWVGTVLNVESKMKRRTASVGIAGLETQLKYRQSLLN